MTATLGRFILYLGLILLVGLMQTPGATPPDKARQPTP